MPDEAFNQASKNTHIWATRVFLLSLFSSNFDDQSSPNFHRFIILCKYVEIHQVRMLVFDINRRCLVAFKHRDNIGTHHSSFFSLVVFHHLLLTMTTKDKDKTRVLPRCQFISCFVKNFQQLRFGQILLIITFKIQVNATVFLKQRFNFVLVFFTSYTRQKFLNVLPQIDFNFKRFL